MRSLATPLSILILLLTILWAESITARHESPGPVHIVYWDKWTGFEQEAMQAVVDEYNRSQSKIHVEFLSISGIQDKTLLAISGGQPPDVVGLENPDVARFADANALLPLDDYCKKYGITAEKYIPAYWSVGFYRGKIWALYTTPSATGLIYNRRLLKEAGFDPDRPPETLEELDAMAEKMTQKDPDGHLQVAGFVPAEPGWWNWAWGYLFGGKLWDGKSKITANSPENIRAYEWVQSFSKKYGTTNLSTFRSSLGAFSSPQNGFMSEKVGMEMQGVWMYNFISQYSPKLQWAAAPMPHPKDRPDLAKSAIVEIDLMMIPRGAKHPDEAFDFIAFAQSVKGMEILNLKRRQHTPLREVSPDFYAKNPNPYVKLFAELPNYNPINQPQMGIWPEYMAELNNAFEEIAIMNSTPKAALDRVQARMQPKLDEYLRLRDRRAALAK